MTEKLIAGIYLGISAVFDLRNRKLPFWLMAAGGAVCVTDYLVRTVQGHTTPAEGAAGLLPGIFLILTAVLSDGKIGAADGISFLITGVLLGLSESFFILVFSLVLSSAWCVIMLLVKKIGKKTDFPFLPFVFLGFLACMTVGAMQ